MSRSEKAEMPNFEAVGIGCPSMARAAFGRGPAQAVIDL
jgi:hypothetical protein